MNKFAIPVSFMDEQSKIGSVKIVATDGPPLTVIGWEPSYGDDKNISIEFEDFTKVANSQYDTILRLCLHIADARRLMEHLIARLSETGDKRAQFFASFKSQIAKLAHELAVVNERPAEIAHCTFRLSAGQTTKTRYACSISSEKNVSEVFAETAAELLMLVRKYAEVFNLLIKVKDNQRVLDEIHYQSFLHPYMAPSPEDSPKTVATCKILHCLQNPAGLPSMSDVLFELESHDDKRTFHSARDNVTQTLFEIASLAWKENLLVKFVDPQNVLAKYNVKNIFGRNLYEATQTHS